MLVEIVEERPWFDRVLGQSQVLEHSNSRAVSKKEAHVPERVRVKLVVQTFNPSVNVVAKIDVRPSLRGQPQPLQSEVNHQFASHKQWVVVLLEHVANDSVVVMDSFSAQVSRPRHAPSSQTSTPRRACVGRRVGDRTNRSIVAFHVDDETDVALTHPGGETEHGLAITVQVCCDIVRPKLIVAVQCAQ